MTPMQMHKLKKNDLIAIAFWQQKKIAALREENRTLQEQISSPCIDFKQPGSIADAAKSVLSIFQNAQQQAEKYLHT